MIALLAGVNWLGLAKRLWWSIPITLLAVTLLLTRHTLASTKGDLKKEQARVVKLVGALQVTQTSLDGALGQIKDNNRRIEAAAAELERAKREAAANEARNATLARSTDAEIAALNERARDGARKPCTLSNEARKALEGL